MTPCPTCAELVAKLQAAEAEVVRLKATKPAASCGVHVARHYSCCSAYEIIRLQAEVARLGKEVSDRKIECQSHLDYARRVAENHQDLLDKSRLQLRTRIAELESKIQDAGVAIAADDQASHIIEWKSRAEAAEAEVAELRKHFADSNHNLILAQAEVARLTLNWNDAEAQLNDTESRLNGENASLRTRVAELEDGLRSMANDGCGLHDMDAHTCCRDRSNNQDDWCWSCQAHRLLDGRGE